MSDSALADLATTLEKLTIIVKTLIKDQKVIAKSLIDLGTDNENIQRRLEALEVRNV